VVGYNVQIAVEAKHHLIVAHEVTNVGHDRGQLANMAGQAKAAMGAEQLEVLADRGDFDGEEVRACEAAGAIPYVPKPLTSGAKADGRFGKPDFVYLADEDAYRFPAASLLRRHMTTVENGMTLHHYWDRASCKACALKPKCTPGKERRVTGWEHEAVLEAMQDRLDRHPKATRIRRGHRRARVRYAEGLDGRHHLRMRTLAKVRTEMSLQVLAYNLRRLIAILGVGPLIQAIAA
jgi:transposase